MKKTLQEQYKDIVSKYLNAFCGTELYYEIIDIGLIYDISNRVLSFDDIRINVDNKLGYQHIFEWYDYYFEASQNKKDKIINYRTWVWGRRQENL